MPRQPPARWRPPRWLPADAELWHKAIITQLRDANRLESAQPIHALLLAQALAQYERCTQALNEAGQVLTLRNDKGEVKREEIAPEAQLQLRLLDKIRALLKDLNLVGTEGKDSDAAEETGDPLAGLRAGMERIAGGGDASRN